MNDIFTLNEIACWYWALAVGVSAYQAYRGFRLQWLLGLDSPRNPPPPVQSQQAPKRLSDIDRVVILALADCLTYALCSLSGFYSILVAYRIAHLAAAEAPVAHPAILIFLILYGVLGATGKLPDTLNKLKAPGLEK
jgi:hypothetical protein